MYTTNAVKSCARKPRWLSEYTCIYTKRLRVQNRTGTYKFSSAKIAAKVYLVLDSNGKHKDKDFRRNSEIEDILNLA